MDDERKWESLWGSHQWDVSVEVWVRLFMNGNVWRGITFTVVIIVIVPSKDVAIHRQTR